MIPNHKQVIEANGMVNKAINSLGLIKIWAGIALLTVLTGCVGYVGGGYGGTVIVPGPDVYFWGGDHDRGRDVHVYSQRGVESRAVAHPSRQESTPSSPRQSASSSAHSGESQHGRKQ